MPVITAISVRQSREDGSISLIQVTVGGLLPNLPLEMQLLEVGAKLGVWVARTVSDSSGNATFNTGDISSNRFKPSNNLALRIIVPETSHENLKIQACRPVLYTGFRYFIWFAKNPLRLLWWWDDNYWVTWRSDTDTD
jgi:hypothetical protein